MVGAIIGGIASAIAGGVKIAGSVVVAGVKVVGQVASSGIKVISSGANAITSGVSTAAAGAIKVGKAAFSKDKSGGSSNNGGGSGSAGGGSGSGSSSISSGSSGTQSQKLGPRAEAVRLIREKQELKKQQAREEFGYGGSGQQADDARDSADLVKEDDRAEKMRVLQEMKTKRAETEKKVAEVSKQKDADLATSVKKRQESNAALLEMKAKTARMEAETATLQAQTANIVASSRTNAEGQNAAAKKAELSRRIAEMRAAQTRKAEESEQLPRAERVLQSGRVSSEFSGREATQKNQNPGNAVRTREVTANIAEVSREFSDVPRRSGGRVSKPTNFGTNTEETSVFD